MHLAFELSGTGLRRRGTGQVQIGLVEARDLDPIAEPPQDLHHAARRPTVELDVAIEQHGLRAARRAEARGIAESTPNRRAS